MLVSDAVRVLQKDLTAGLGVAAAPELAFSDGTSFCCTSKPRAIKHLVEQKKNPQIHARNRPPESVDYLGLWHEHDLRVDLVGLRLRLLKLGEHVSTPTEIAPPHKRRAQGTELAAKLGGNAAGRGGTLSSTLSTRQSSLEGRS